jgi:hypothetical protein
MGLIFIIPKSEDGNNGSPIYARKFKRVIIIFDKSPFILLVIMMLCP